MFVFRLLAAWLLLLTLMAPTVSLAKALGVEPSLAFETQSPSSGSQVKIALVMEAKPGWHAYWSYPGEVGAPPRIEWSAPEGFTFSGLKHPAPKFMDVQGIASFVHEGSFALITSMRVPNGLAKGEPIPISARISWLACSETQCVPETKIIEVILVAGSGETDYPGLSKIRQAEAKIPSETINASFSYSEGKMILRLPPGSPASGKIFPSGTGWLKSGSSQEFSQSKDGVTVSVNAAPSQKEEIFSGIIKGGSETFLLSAKWVAPEKTSADEDTSVDNLSGSPLGDLPIVETAEAGEASSLRSSDDQPTSDPASRSENLFSLPSVALASSEGTSFVAVLLAAFAGGLLLNLMPCVFPILSLKALSLAKSSSGEKQAKAEGIGYTLGTVGAILAMGSFVLIAREFGASAGWSFQLQSPAFVMAMLALVVLITLNLAGSFEFAQMGRGSGLSAPGFRGSVGTGAMAALIASPCAGPFMAGALGAALLLPTPSALSVFAGLGLGMAFPFLLIAFIPQVRSSLPKPGMWMGKLRKILSIPMGLTAVWLGWIIWRQTGAFGLTWSIVLVVMIVLGTGLIGKRQKAGLSGQKASLFLVGIVLAALFTFPLMREDAYAEAHSKPAGDLMFSEAELEKLVSQGQPVLLDFTADWCLTCKVNEKVALHTDAVEGAFADAGIVVMTGDWTDGDPAITEFLEKNGRNSIPFYVLYDGKGGAKVLPQILTPSLLIEEAKSVSAGP